MVRMLPIEPPIAEIKNINANIPPTINNPFSPNNLLIIVPDTLIVFSASPFVLLAISFVFKVSSSTSLGFKFINSFLIFIFCSCFSFSLTLFPLVPDTDILLLLSKIILSFIPSPL